MDRYLATPPATFAEQSYSRFGRLLENKIVFTCLFTDSDLMFDANSGGVTICGFVENLTNLI